MTYAVIYEHGLNEQGREPWSAYVPDVPGCMSAGETREAIELHLEGLRDEGLPIPRPISEASAVPSGGRTAFRSEVFCDPTAAPGPNTPIAPLTIHHKQATTPKRIIGAIT
jgi:predicted RNase H-like HicB family nuclease